MEFIIHTHNGTKIAELKKGSMKVTSSQDILDIMANANDQESTSQVIYEEDLGHKFFALKTGLAGEILQKYSNYRNSVAIVGDSSNVESKSLRDFIYESNKTGRISFVSNIESAKEILTSK